MSQDVKAILVGLGVIGIVVTALGTIFSITWAFTDDLRNTGEIFLLGFAGLICVVILGGLLLAFAGLIGEIIIDSRKRRKKKRGQLGHRN